MNAHVKSIATQTDAYVQARVDLAACYRLAAHFGLNEGIDNHLTLLVPGYSDRFLLAPFERLYFLERAAQAQVLALSTGRALRLVPETVVKATVAQSHSQSGSMVGGRDRAELRFEALKRMLDRTSPDYAR
jgi:ribulose-5-phosphate 4-epimerase/fuculose-1-phosphate aldolase